MVSRLLFDDVRLTKTLRPQLAGTYKSLSFVHAVNDLRTNCTTLSTSSIAPLIHSKRAQFIPVQWRTDLEFEDELDSGADQEDESLGNRFNLEECVLLLRSAGTTS